MLDAANTHITEIKKERKKLICSDPAIGEREYDEYKLVCTCGYETHATMFIEIARTFYHPTTKTIREKF